MQSLPTQIELRFVETMTSIADRLHDGGAKVFSLYGLRTDTTKKQSCAQIGKDITIKRQKTAFVWRIWSDDIGGDCIKFLQHVENITQAEAVTRLKRIYGDLPVTISAPPSRARQLLQEKQDKSATGCVFDAQELREKPFLIGATHESITMHKRAPQYFSDKTGGIVTSEIADAYGVSVLENYTTKSEQDNEAKFYDFNRSADTPLIFAFPSDRLHDDLSKTSGACFENVTLYANSSRHAKCVDIHTRQYIYRNSPKQYFKIKSPYAKAGALRAWYIQTRASLLSKYESDRYSFGMNMLPYCKEGDGKTLNPYYTFVFADDVIKDRRAAYVCEGEIDCLALNALGFPAFTFGGVVKLLRDDEVKRLRESGIERLIIVFDQDTAGRDAAAAFMRSADNLRRNGLALRSAELPKLSGEKDDKDVCDYLKRFGADADLMRALIAAAGGSNDDDSTRHTYKRRGTDMEMQAVSVDKHISEASDKIINALDIFEKMQIVAPTGTGKTFAAVQIGEKLASEGQRVVIAQPSTLAVEQTGKTYNIFALSSAAGFDELAMMQARGDRLVVTTWDSLQHCGDFDVLIVDEIHEAAKSYSYRRKAVRSVVQMMKRDDIKVIAITATPDSCITAIAGLVTIQIHTNNPQRLNIIEANVYADEKQKRNRLRISEMITSWCIDVVKKGRRAAVRLNDKKKIAAIKEALDRSGICGVETMTADEKKQAGGVFENIIERSELPEGCKVLLTTCVLDTAVNIRGNDFDVMFVCDGHNADADNIVQFSARFRDMKRLDVTLLFSHIKQETRSARTCAESFEAHLEIATQAAVLFNTMQRLAPDEIITAKTIKGNSVFAYESSVIKAKRSDGSIEYQPCEAWCLSKAVEETSERTAGDIAEVFVNMNTAGITDVRYSEGNAAAFSTDTSCEVRAADEAVKEKIETMTEEVISELQNNEETILHAIGTMTQNSEVKEAIKKHLRCVTLKKTEDVRAYIKENEEKIGFFKTEKIASAYVADIADGFDKDDAIAMQRKMSGSNSRSNFKKILRAMQLVETPRAAITDGRDLAKHDAMTKLLTMFNEGERLSGHEIRHRVEQCTTGTPMTFDNKSAVTLVKSLFGAVRQGKAMTYHIGKRCFSDSYCAKYGIKPPRLEAVRSHISAYR